MVEVNMKPEKYKVDPETGCWNWLLSLTKKGYGRRFFMGQNRGAHRVAFYLAYGYWPKEIAHSCFNRACVNPEHLRDSSHTDNIRESAASKLDMKKADLIRSQYKGQYGDRVKLADKFFVSVATVGRVLRGDSWA